MNDRRLTTSTQKVFMKWTCSRVTEWTQLFMILSPRRVLLQGPLKCVCALLKGPSFALFYWKERVAACFHSKSQFPTVCYSLAPRLQHQASVKMCSCIFRNHVLPEGTRRHSTRCTHTFNTRNPGSKSAMSCRTLFVQSRLFQFTQIYGDLLDDFLALITE